MKKKRKNKAKKILMSVSILLVILIILLIMQFDIIESFSNNEEKIVVGGECSLFMGNLVDKINDDAGCKTICKYECEIVGKELKDSEFVERESSCNGCDCYCR